MNNNNNNNRHWIKWTECSGDCSISLQAEMISVVWRFRKSNYKTWILIIDSILEFEIVQLQILRKFIGNSFYSFTSIFLCPFLVIYLNRKVFYFSFYFMYPSTIRTNAKFVCRIYYFVCTQKWYDVSNHVRWILSLSILQNKNRQRMKTKRTRVDLGRANTNGFKVDAKQINLLKRKTISLAMFFF